MPGRKRKLDDALFEFFSKEVLFFVFCFFCSYDQLLGFRVFYA
jgi:hypothetical protein